MNTTADKTRQFCLWSPIVFTPSTQQDKTVLSRPRRRCEQAITDSVPVVQLLSGMYDVFSNPDRSVWILYVELIYGRGEATNVHISSPAISWWSVYQ